MNEHESYLQSVKPAYKVVIINVSYRGRSVSRVAQAVSCSTEEEEAERAQWASAVRPERTEPTVSGTQFCGGRVDVAAGGRGCLSEAGGHLFALTPPL